ncbi:MAG: 5-formyltetrahydrofolate cyclo-ligase [Phycisphaeraceae bacterium]|nr:5-formyltetrahydrofolate cyclo-ligase [Phycisphaeraceae bacterium]
MARSFEKESLRIQSRRVLGAISRADVARWSGHIVEGLTNDPFLVAASCVLVYAPIQREPDLSLLTESLLQRGVRVAMPRVDWDSKSMTPAHIESLESLEPSRHGVLNPPSGAPPLSPDAIDLALVPGLSFDRLGGRLGRGGGYYDAFLGDSRWNGRAMGVCFEAQLVQSVPRQAHDALMDALATERGVRWIRS